MMVSKRDTRKNRLVFITAFLLLAVLISPLPASAATYIVSKTDDTNDGTCDSDCSLREAITAANGTLAADSITLPSGTYTFSLGLLPNLSSDITINGSSASTTIISGGDTQRVFNINGGTVTLNRVTIADGARLSGGASVFGAGIQVVSGSSLTVIDSIVRDNVVEGYGGGIMNFGTLIVLRSTIMNNAVSGTPGIAGAGIANTGTAHIINSTISGNTSVAAGAGVYNQGTMTLINSTIYSNSAANGDSIFGSDGTVTVQNSIVADSDGGGNCYVEGSGSIVDNGTNIDRGTSCGFGGSLNNTDPLLDSLADNGGNTLTHALFDSSPAINAGTNAKAVDQTNAPLTTDQRGTGFDRILDGIVDIGAFEAEEVAGASLMVQHTLQRGSVTPPHASYVISGNLKVFAVGDTTTPLQNLSYTTNTSGAYTFASLPTGTYDMRFKGSHTLARLVTVTINGGVLNMTSPPVLLEGDADNNNVVNIIDFSSLAAAFGKSLGVAGYNPQADFNQDNVVNILDFSLLASNFGKVGEGGTGS